MQVKWRIGPEAGCMLRLHVSTKIDAAGLSVTLLASRNSSASSAPFRDVLKRCGLTELGYPTYRVKFAINAPRRAK